ncbi:cyclic lactone autoinducer peptide [Schinkia azotoformans]|uniref:cyclic lactone autoinducer peptide n=1 Tax=Schinkia azotoformans TaxID=1454 RepID=UPI002DB97418|nr:cyclic lactone autoinducer peptide [Schinkia azotoformans]MEC1717900.1 cyclic lactone autoinducer peptide [Schinkia azotoformans]MEC1741067.1 cyclic lactone autoinducer peptide [Schinkia azotoformans]MEC1744212.1 cyclic lactone autoinducer peptide [Schinkia azotoformans]MEC1756630.1 cyclic lactone autoinducer peptide [Schinkia azotoformans]MEC1768078.1 cyclic lactone autoinducer peptide [Schinkia azotoformans]
MNNYRSTKNLLVKTLSNLAITFSGIAIIQGCTFFLHEEELPEVLKNEHPFK